MIDPKVAATAAFALQGVMSCGGTGAASNPDDGTPLIGKTGTHESYQTWMIESSTKVATAVWVGNSTARATSSSGTTTASRCRSCATRSPRGSRLRRMPSYGGDAFPDADSNLTRQVLRDLPNVDRHARRSGDGNARARPASTSSSARRWTPPRPRASSPRRIPGAGRVSGGTAVTINPSNGQGVAVPDVAGKQLDQAVSELRAAGFGNVQPGTCTEDATAGIQGKVIGHEPACGHGREPQRGDHGGHTAASSAPSGADSAHKTALTALAAVGAVGAGAAIWGIGIERYLFTVREHAVRILPTGTAPLRVLHLSDAHMAPWQRRKQRWMAALADHWRPDLVVNTGDNLGHAEGLRGLRAALDPLRGIPGVFVHGSNDHAAPSPRNPLRYFTGPSKVKTASEPLDTQALDGYLGDELGWLDLNNAVGSLEVCRPPRRRVRGQRRPPRLGPARGASGSPATTCRPTSHPPRSRIGVTHAPYRRVLDSFVGLGADMIFAGHTHGGQVRVPGLRRARRQLRHPAAQARGLSDWTHARRAPCR